jgi:hypothetical protein
MKYPHTARNSVINCPEIIPFPFLDSELEYLLPHKKIWEGMQASLPETK